MTLVLLRVDERLIHGQVVVGWGNRLHPDRIIVVDDELAGSEWEQELYTLGLPAGLDATFATVAGARERLDDWRQATERLVLLTRDIETMRRLGEDGLLQGDEVNLGGLHYAPGRAAVLPYLYLSPDERAAAVRLEEGGARVSARDLPGARRIDLRELLGSEDA